MNNIQYKTQNHIVSHKNKVLIVDDSVVNRTALRKILEDDYELLEATNGLQAWELLRNYKTDISIILLDLVMPVMDGYTFLEYVQADHVMSMVPIIVMTSNDSIDDEMRCLSLGASDFIPKPYHPIIVKQRIKNLIHLRETSAALNLLEYDQLTGVYSKEFFYQYAQKVLTKYPEKHFNIVCCDVENFKLVNERFGVEKGDELLCYLAEKYSEILGNFGFCARINADVFAMLIEISEEDILETLFTAFQREQMANAPVPNLVIKWGVYEIEDRTIPISHMCDRAILAIKEIKHQYNHNIIWYDDHLRLDMLKEQQVLDMMEIALTEKQFKIYLQPKYDVQTNKIVGAEVLVRWIHPEKGMISPSEFIPIFEQNGFISSLDYYVWEETCSILAFWRDKGLPLIPLSVNVSRVNFEAGDLEEKLVTLLERYKLIPDWLHLEITESAYTENPEKIINTVDNLRKKGFKIEMDDFGSGYSSLNMLSELPIDILKLDMRFMQHENKYADKKSILGFIVSLSKWLELDTVAEGVETKEQLDLLRNMGCDYVQGYYYARPMPTMEFESYLVNEKLSYGKEERLFVYEGASETEKQEKNTVLIVEDLPETRKSLQEILSPYYNLIISDSGRDAYSYLQKNEATVSIILMDLFMAVMDGFQVLEFCKKREADESIPIIMSSSDGNKDELQAIQLGASDFLSKPYKKETLLYHIQHVLEDAELRKKYAREAVRS